MWTERCAWKKKIPCESGEQCDPDDCWQHVCVLLILTDVPPSSSSPSPQADVAILVVAAPVKEFDSGFCDATPAPVSAGCGLDGDEPDAPVRENSGQTKENAILLRSLGVRNLIVAVNKMDQVGDSCTVCVCVCLIQDVFVCVCVCFSGEAAVVLCVFGCLCVCVCVLAGGMVACALC